MIAFFKSSQVSMVFGASPLSQVSGAGSNAIGKLITFMSLLPTYSGGVAAYALLWCVLVIVFVNADGLEVLWVDG